MIYRPTWWEVLRKWLLDARQAHREKATLPAWWEARVALLGYHGEYEEAARVIREHRR